MDPAPKSDLYPSKYQTTASHPHQLQLPPFRRAATVEFSIPDKAPRCLLHDLAPARLSTSPLPAISAEELPC